MKGRKFTAGITFFVSTEMFNQIKAFSDEKQVSSSELIRDSINFYLANQRSLKGTESNGQEEEKTWKI
ncbi:MAG: CopG family transcriptional regulator [Thermodesulfobacteriota bacterium]|jgi:hypothetical protein